MPNNSEMVQEIVDNVQLIFREELSNFASYYNEILDKRFEEQDKRIDEKLNKRFEEQDKRIDEKLNKRFEEQEKRFDEKLNKRLEEQERRIEKKLEKMMDEKFEKYIKEISEEIHNIIAYFEKKSKNTNDKLDDEIEGNLLAHNSYDARLYKLEKVQTRLEKKVSNI